MEQVGDSRNCIITVGSRRSELALIQANIIISRLLAIEPTSKIFLREIESTGDRNQDIALDKIGVTSVFTKELEIQLLQGDLRIAVHSLKDLACAPIPGLCLAAYVEREDPRDCVVFRDDLKNKGLSLMSLIPGSVVGTSSPRRASLIQRYFPHLMTRNIRGNIRTRLKLLNNSGKYSAIVLSMAALIRLNIATSADEVISLEIFPPAPGQGCIVAQCKTKDIDIIKLLRKVSHVETEVCCTAERSFMYAVMAGCSVPIGAHAFISSNKAIVLSGTILSRDGGEIYSKTVTHALICPIDISNQEKNIEIGASMGNKLRDEMIKMGASALIDTLLSAPDGRASRHTPPGINHPVDIQHK